MSYAFDLLFDWRHGTDTVRRVHMRELAFESENKVHSSCYGATKAGPFRKLLARLALPTDCTFVDIGCGKGRVLMLAAQWGFRRVVGIEFSPELCRIARSNLQIFTSKVGLKADVSVVEADAARYPYAADEQVYYLFNPFNGILLAEVLKGIQRSLEAAPRKVWLIYMTPRYHDVVAASGVFARTDDHTIQGMEFKVYSNSGH